MKIINIILTILFALFAFFQLNDPDAATWFILYGYVAVMSGMAIFKKHSLPFLIPGIAIFALYFMYNIPSIIEWIGSGDSLMDRMSVDKNYIEESREGLGLLLALLVLVFHLVTRNRYAKLKRVG